MYHFIYLSLFFFFSLNSLSCSAGASTTNTYIFIKRRHSSYSLRVLTIKMLSGKHYKKKMDKRAKKKAAKKDASGAAPQQSKPSPHHPSSLPSARPSVKTKSTLKGPVVGYGERAARDGGNDHRGVPFLNAQEAKSYQGGRKEGKSGKKGQANAPAPTQTPLRRSLASSQAQRRRVLRAKGGEDLLAHFKEQLHASTFRLLNEELYNSPNAYAAQLLREESTFQDYHRGYRQQLVQWPLNPNHIIIESVLKNKNAHFSVDGLASPSSSKPTSTTAPAFATTPNSMPTSWVIADMGCGDAQIANALKPLGYTVHSFDFCALNPHVTIADSTNVPLQDASVDVCVFSLSLMATDYEKSLFEAFRILKPNRVLKIVEVRSRIPFPRRFSEMICSIGFTVAYENVAGDYFVAFDFIKDPRAKKPNPSILAHAPSEVLLPSLYKKR